MFAAGVISVCGECNKCSRGNTWNKQPATDQSDYSISLKYGINYTNIGVGTQLRLGYAQSKKRFFTLHLLNYLRGMMLPHL